MKNSRYTNLKNQLNLNEDEISGKRDLVLDNKLMADCFDKNSALTSIMDLIEYESLTSNIAHDHSVEQKRKIRNLKILYLIIS